MAAFFNRATLSYNNNTVTSNIVTGEITEALTATKSVLPETYTTGDILTYVITLINSGTADMTGVTITDDLGAYTYETTRLTPLTFIDGSILVFVNGAPAPEPPSEKQTGLVISSLTVPAGGNTVVIYQTQVNEYASPLAGSAITNTAQVTGQGIAEAVTATASATAENAPELSILKALSPSTVTENSSVTYTFTIQNEGTAEATAADNVIVYDTFDPILSDLSVSLNGTPLALTTGYTYDAVTGEFATVAGAITVPAAQYTIDPATGAWSGEPGTATLTVTGTI